MHWACASKYCNTQDEFILVEVRLGLLTLNCSNERLQILLGIWHSVMCLKDRSKAQKRKLSIITSVQNNPQMCPIMGWSAERMTSCRMITGCGSTILRTSSNWRKKKKKQLSGPLHFTLNWKQTANLGTAMRSPLTELQYDLRHGTC